MLLVCFDLLSPFLMASNLCLALFVREDYACFQLEELFLGIGESQVIAFIEPKAVKAPVALELVRWTGRAQPVVSCYMVEPSAVTSELNEGLVLAFVVGYPGDELPVLETLTPASALSSRT